MLLFRGFYAFYASSPGKSVIVRYLIDSGFGFPFDAGLAGGSPAATHFSLLRQRKVSKRKATRLSGSLRFATGNLRCAPKAGVRPNSLHCVALKQCAALIPLLGHITGPARTGLSGSETRDKNQNPIQTGTRRGVSLGTSEFGIWYLVFGCSAVRSHPLCLRRGAQLQADQGCALSEPQASLRRPRLKRAPQAARSAAQGRRHQGRLFLGDFLLAKQKKVTRRRATPGQQPSAAQQKHKSTMAGNRP